MKPLLRSWSIIAAIWLFCLLPFVASAQHVPGKFLSSDQAVRRANSAVTLPMAHAISSNQVPIFTLGTLSAREREIQPRFGVKQIGVVRQLRETALAPSTTVLPDGSKVLRLIVESPGALALRVHIKDAAIGVGQLWIYPRASTGPYKRVWINGRRSFWSGVVESDSAVIEFDGPATYSARTFPFQIDSIAHHWGTVFPDASRVHLEDSTETGPAACELDITCYPSYAQFGTGVPLLTFVADSGGSYTCSGALINTASQTFDPYMLTAHHCIGSDAEAQSIVAYFGYQTQTCNATADFGYSSAQEGGASYLAGSNLSGGDYALVRFNVAARQISGYYFGWSQEDPAIGDSVVGIHHPEASWTRISFGTRTTDEPENIDGVLAPAAAFFQVGYTQGIVEPGSSGSPLLNSSGEIVGTLTGASAVGLAACNLNPFYASYGRFSTAYPALQPYLNGDPAPPFSVSPVEVTLSDGNGPASGPSSQTLTLTTSSPSLVPFSISAADEWVLDGEIASGMISASAPFYLPLSGGGAFELAGTYRSSISVSVGSGKPLVIPFTLTVTNTASNVLMSVNTDQGSFPSAITPVSGPANELTWPLSINLSESAGVETQLTGLKVGAQDFSAQLVTVFGTTTIKPSQTITGFFAPANIPVYTTQIIEVDGTDPGSGNTWSKQLYSSFGGTVIPSPPLIPSGYPGIVRLNASNPSCPYLQHVTLRNPGTSPLSLVLFQGIDGPSYSLSQIQSVFGSSLVAAGGTVQGDFCWPSSQLLLEFEGDSRPEDTSFAANLYPAAPSFAELSATPTSFDMTPAGINGHSISVDPGSESLSWSASLIFNQQPSSWLAIAPTTGTGAGLIQVTINPAGLIPGGLYQASIIVQSENSTPQYIDIPIIYRPTPPSLAVVNAASFSAGIAPGSIVSVFDSAGVLAADSISASTVPLPTTLGATNVGVNGVPAPFYYASATQLNVQIPYETQPGTATMSVHTSAGQTVSQQIYVNSEAPGIFLADGVHIAPNVAVKAGGYATLYFTGQGNVSPAVATGASPPSPGQVAVSGLPAPYANVSVYVGGTLAQNSFVGIPYYLVGLTQVNFLVPPTTPSGDEPVQLVVGVTKSNTAMLTVQ